MSRAQLTPLVFPSDDACAMNRRWAWLAPLPCAGAAKAVLVELTSGSYSRRSRTLTYTAKPLPLTHPLGKTIKAAGLQTLSERGGGRGRQAGQSWRRSCAVLGIHFFP